MIALAAVSFDLPAAAVATGISESRIKEAQKAGELVAHYNGARPIYRAADLDEWVQSLPTERPGKRAS